MTQEIFDSLPEHVVIYGNFQTKDVFVNATGGQGTVDSQRLDIKPSQAVWKHSNEFNWSYSGGPAQLSLAILMLFMPTEEAQKYYQEFKRLVVAGWPDKNFEVTLNLKEEFRKIVPIL